MTGQLDFKQDNNTNLSVYRRKYIPALIYKVETQFTIETTKTKPVSYNDWSRIIQKSSIWSPLRLIWNAKYTIIRLTDIIGL